MIFRTVLKTHKEHGCKGLCLLFSYYFQRIVSQCVGPGKECPLCGWRGPEFAPFLNFTDNVIRPKARCPECGSLERHRGYKFFYEKFFEEYEKGSRRILHFAPEKCFEKILKTYASEYVKSNYENPAPGELSLDLRDLKLEAKSFDILVMNYVLSCRPGDLQAVKNMHRVLETNGVVLAGECVDPDKPTVEYPSVVYGGRHRSYGMLDIMKRFYPFEVEAINITGGLAGFAKARYGLNCPEYMIILRKKQSE